MAKDKQLYPEDQAKVDKILSEGVNSVERRPFRPLRLLIALIVIVITLTALSVALTRWAGITGIN